jgi:PAS domain S-box-containing protein
MSNRRRPMSVKHKQTSSWCSGTAFFIFILLVNIFGSALAQDNVRPDVLEVTAAVPREFPPYYGVDSRGRPEGFAIDIMEQVAAMSGLRVTYLVEDSWSDVENAVKSGRAVVIPNIGISESREAWLDFTAPVETLPISIFVRGYTSDIGGVDDLMGRKVAAVKFNVGVDLLREREQSEIKVFNDPREALLELLAGRVDAVVYPGPVFLKLVREAGLEHRIRVAGKPLKEIRRAIGVAEGNMQLLRRLDQAVNSFVGTKDYVKVFNKWFGEPLPFWSTTRVVLVVFGIGLALFFLMAGWRYYSLIQLNRRLSASITERKQAEEALSQSHRELHETAKRLEQSRNMLQLVVESIPVRVFWKDKDLRFLGCNTLFARDAGLSRAEQLLGLDDFDMGWREQAELYRADDRKVMESGLPYLNIVEPQSTPTGASIWLNTSKVPLHMPNGEVFGVLGVYEDITERKQAEEERRMLEERLQRAEKMEALGTLAGGVAHDLNNVLGIVVGYSELLLDGSGESSSARSTAMEIMKGAQRAAAIVQDLLTLARRGVSNRKVLNLNNIVMECQNSPEFAKALSCNPTIGIKTDLEPDLLNVSGSSIHLGKSFINLFFNAVEAMPNGGTLTLKTANCYLDKPISGYDEVREGDYVVLSISDTGEGIPASDLKRIFEPFYTKKVMGRSGTGLGLAVVWGTVKDHLGYVNVESEEGEGTTFTLYFPVTREEVSQEEPSISASEYMGNGESILVVDDVKEQRGLASTMLSKLNYKVSSVSSGEEAVEYIEQHTVDLVVLDMIMDPGMDGLETYLKILEIYPHQKAIIVSGFSDTEQVAKAQELGAGAYVKKPYVLEKLGLAVKKELDRQT